MEYDFHIRSIIVSNDCIKRTHILCPKDSSFVNIDVSSKLVRINIFNSVKRHAIPVYTVRKQIFSKGIDICSYINKTIDITFRLWKDNQTLQQHLFLSQIFGILIEETVRTGVLSDLLEGEISL